MAPFTHLSPPGHALHRRPLRRVLRRRIDRHRDRRDALSPREFPARHAASRPSSSRCAATSPTSPASCTTCARAAREMPDIYDPASYAASQKLGRELREAGSNGIAFDSVRRDGRRMRGDLPAAARAERAPERASALRLGRQRHLRGLRNPRGEPVAPQPGIPVVSRVAAILRAGQNATESCLRHSPTCRWAHRPAPSRT